jgi:hypothetical protein
MDGGKNNRKSQGCGEAGRASKVNNLGVGHVHKRIRRHAQEVDMEVRGTDQVVRLEVKFTIRRRACVFRCRVILI